MEQVLPEISLHRFAPEYKPIPNTSGFFGCLREMGPEDRKFERDGPAASITKTHVIRREKPSASYW